jgi:hypothetical protein
MLAKILSFLFLRLLSILVGAAQFVQACIVGTSRGLGTRGTFALPKVPVAFFIFRQIYKARRFLGNATILMEQNSTGWR